MSTAPKEPKQDLSKLTKNQKKNQKKKLKKKQKRQQALLELQEQQLSEQTEDGATTPTNDGNHIGEDGDADAEDEGSSVPVTPVREVCVCVGGFILNITCK